MWLLTPYYNKKGDLCQLIKVLFAHKIIRKEEVRMPIYGGNLKYMKGGYNDGRFRVHHFPCRLLGG